MTIVWFLMDFSCLEMAGILILGPCMQHKMYLRKKVSSQTGKIVQERKRAKDETLAKDFIDAEHLPYLGHQYKELDKLHVFLGWVALLVMSFIRLGILLNMALVLPFSLVIFPI